MQHAKTLRQYRKAADGALNNAFLRQTLDNFAVAYRTGRANAFAGIDIDALVREIAEAKDSSLKNLDELYEAFKDQAEAAGVHVHLAETADDANALIARIAEDNQVRKIVKSKSMTAEETLLNHHLEAAGLTVTETDLGEWIIQLRNEGPTHMVMPAIHLSRHQVADLFTEVTGKSQESDIEQLVKVARRELRQRYVEADMGITGANFAIADTGTLGIITNEGNARLVTTLPRVHVALVGIEKLTPTLHDALRVLRALPRNATGQIITSYVTWITGTPECAAAEGGRKISHVIFLDNGRRALAKDPIFSEVLRCVRCGACANVCPVYRMLGGHQYGHIYIGAIGLILTYFFHGRDKAKNIVQNCINCEACKAVCAAGIDLPRIIKAVHARIQDEDGHPVTERLLGIVLRHRRLFHAALRTAEKLQGPVTDGTPYIRHLPHFLDKDHGFRALPAIAERPFRDRWPEIAPTVTAPKSRVALFAGCVQDFVYPEHLEAAVSLMADAGAAVEFPDAQSCCGLPVAMMGEAAAARDVARQNLAAINPDRYDQIVTLCASCAAHLKNAYPRLLADVPGAASAAEAFSEKVMSFSAYLHDVLGVTEETFLPPDDDAGSVTFHAPCHLCRGVKMADQAKAMIRRAGIPFVPAEEEQTCCGFGGTYSSKFPHISAEILARKLDDFEKTGAKTIVTECPGCVMQLRGGAVKRGGKMDVRHIVEVLDERRR